MGSFNSISLAWITIGLLATGCGQITTTNSEAETFEAASAEELSNDGTLYKMTAQTSVNGQVYALEVAHSTTISPTLSMAIANNATTYFANTISWWSDASSVDIKIINEAMAEHLSESPLVESFGQFLCIPGFTTKTTKQPKVECAVDPAILDDEIGDEANAE